MGLSDIVLIDSRQQRNSWKPNNHLISSQVQCRAVAVPYSEESRIGLGFSSDPTNWCAPLHNLSCTRELYSGQHARCRPERKAFSLNLIHTWDIDVKDGCVVFARIKPTISYTVAENRL